ncbi:MAG: hypothetical protein PHQ20_03770, partial [Candidatus Moranbacteria bacterium]|nr:hypothetical protein [Candidatus Moranbacteria bacterium]
IALHGFHKRNELLSEEHQYKDRGIFHQVTIDDDGVKIEMFYAEGKKDPYTSIIINQETAVCNNSTLPEQD